MTKDWELDMTENPKNTEKKADSPPGERLAQRREFLLRGGKILTYSVPVIVSFQASKLKAMASGSLGSANLGTGTDEFTTPDQNPEGPDPGQGRGRGRGRGHDQNFE